MQFDGGEAFSFPMAALKGKVDRLDGAEVKVVAKVRECVLPRWEELDRKLAVKTTNVIVLCTSTLKRRSVTT